MPFTARVMLDAVSRQTPAKFHSTSWLDGMRGMAAFMVAMSHWTEEWLSPFAAAPFGAVVSGDINANDFDYFRKGTRLLAPWRLPIIHLLVDSGSAQVALFFVISGFVLSWGPLELVHSGQYERLYGSIGSSATRRWARLFLPCLAVTTIYVVRDAIINDPDIISAVHRMGTYLYHAVEWANPFLYVDRNVIPPIIAVNIVLWTIPVEFKGSLFIYLLLVAFGRMRDFKLRCTATIVVTLCAFLSTSWSLWLFGTGMLLADYVRHAGGFQRLAHRSTWATVITWTLCLVVGLLLMGFEAESGWYSRPGYEWTAYVPLPPGFRTTVFVGEMRFWVGCGASLVVASSCHLILVRRFFELRFLQYLGRISFMLYLTHVFIHQSLSTHLLAAIKATCPKVMEDAFGTEVYQMSAPLRVATYLLLLLCNVPVLLLVAQLLERYLDRPLTELGKWFDRKLREESPKKQDMVMEVTHPEERQPLVEDHV